MSHRRMLVFGLAFAPAIVALVSGAMTSCGGQAQSGEGLDATPPDATGADDGTLDAPTSDEADVSRDVADAADASVDATADASADAPHESSVCAILLDSSDECLHCSGVHCCSDWSACATSSDCRRFDECVNPGLSCPTGDGGFEPCDGGCDGSGDIQCCEQTYPTGAALWQTYFNCVQQQCGCF